MIIVFFVLGAALALGLSFLEGSDAKKTERGDANLRNELRRSHEIEFEGAKYRLKKGLTTILLMGIDQYADDVDVNPVYNTLPYRYRHGGQSDFLRLLVVDDTAKQIRQVAIDRDTITPITILDIYGKPSGQRSVQLTLQHSFGDGKEQSDQLTVDAVSNLCFGLPIDHYFALNMDGIAELNDWLGGVTVPIEEDFSSVDPTLVQGETMKLTGEQAEHFLRARYTMEIATNEQRMARQTTYLKNAQDLLRARLASDMNSAENFYDSLNSYFTTDMSKGTLSNIAYSTNEYEALEVEQPEGEHVPEDGYMTFHVDEHSLMETILRTFYDKVE